jgi:flagellar hook protein FlgE
MFTSFSTALSALNATSTAIDVVGNNLANMNSAGFKASDMSFSDVVTQSLGAGLGSTQVGFGTATPLTVQDFTQGALQSSGGLLNGAISGEGFFVVQDPTSGDTEYTRAGDFQTDKNGNLQTANGDAVQGWTTVDAATGQIDTNGPVGNIVVPVGSLQAPIPTSTITADLNLNSAQAVDNTTDFSMPITVYDSLGNSHVLTLSFTNAGSNTWNYTATVPAADTADDNSAGDATVATGTLAFNADGSLNLTSSNPTSPITLTMPALADGATWDANAATPNTITWSLTNSSGAGTITQYSQPSASSASSQNGQAASQLVNVGLGNGGTILAQYSDGQQVIVGQVALASIRNPESLVPIGNNNYMLSETSATPNVGVPGTGGRGTIQGGMLEASNVDIASEFTNLIVYQRGYEASGKVVTTADTLSQDTINLIR